MPNGYNIVVNSLKDDLNGAKAICWKAKVLKDDDEGFSYEISKCLYFDTCKVFCTHDWYAYGVLKKHSKFVRKSTIAEDGTVCNDTILKLK